MVSVQTAVMKNILLILCPLLFTLSACKKEKEDVDTGKTNTGVRLSEIYWISQFDRVDSVDNHWYFYYDSKGYLSSVHVYDSLLTHKSPYHPSYQPRITKRDYHRNASNTVTRELITGVYEGKTYTSTAEYVYGTGNDLLKVIYSSGTQVQDSIEYIWGAGKITGIRMNGGDRHMFTYNSDGNVIDISSFLVVNSGRDTVKYINKAEISYDSNPNFVRTIQGLNHPYGLFGLSPECFSKNNMIRYYTDNPPGYVNYTLEYNSDGYVSRSNPMMRNYVYEKVK